MATEAANVTSVLDEELVYRSVHDSRDHHTCDDAGRLLRLGQSAFNDPQRTPSVDRATIQLDGAAASRRNDSHGVVVLVVAEVRGISGLRTLNPKGEPIHEHIVDVKHDPVEGNYSHAVVCAAPEVAGGAWKRLKEALCRVATTRGWAYPPESVRG